MPRGRPATSNTKPCDFCGAPVTKTKTEQGGRKYWTCDASCANKLRVSLGHTRWAGVAAARTSETRPCVHCGGPATFLVSKRRPVRLWVCSPECRGAVVMARRLAAPDYVQPVRRRSGTEQPCASCGKLVYRRPEAGPNEGRYCSVACTNVARRAAQVTKSCVQCGATMRLAPSMAQRRYCSKPCEAAARIVRPLERMQNGKPVKRRTDGYVMVWEPSHPNTTHKGWQFEHRLVLERKLGRLLLRNEHAHHINGIKDDNRPENLEAMDGKDHGRRTGLEHQQSLSAMRAEVAEYRRRFGPLTKEEQ